MLYYNSTKEKIEEKIMRYVYSSIDDALCDEICDKYGLDVESNDDIHIDEEQREYCLKFEVHVSENWDKFLRLFSTKRYRSLSPDALDNEITYFFYDIADDYDLMYEDYNSIKNDIDGYIEDFETELEQGEN